MKIVYTEGPPSVALGAAGTFRRGEPKDVEETLAMQILAKKSIRFREADKPAAPAKAAEKKEG